jgi:hypothetical protein
MTQHFEKEATMAGETTVRSTAGCSGTVEGSANVTEMLRGFLRLGHGPKLASDQVQRLDSAT